MNKITVEYNKGVFIPIVEDDFVARFYYHLLSSYYNVYANRLYVKSRILHDIPNLNQLNKYDIVIGNRNASVKRDYVDPKAVLEFKVFPFGFSSQQLSKRRDGIIADMNKLFEITKYRNDIELYICIFDLIDWLSGYNQNETNTRLENFILHRDQLSTDIKLIGISAKRGVKATVFKY